MQFYLKVFFSIYDSQLKYLYSWKFKMSNISETEHALYMFTKTFKKYKSETFISMTMFSDGLPFANMLSSIQYFASTIDQLDKNPQKWVMKLANLKKLMSSMESFALSQYSKNLKINDIQLIEIAKNNSTEETLKFFQVVMAVLMQTPQKQDYIQTIMGLDQRSQQALVIVVQNAMEFRIFQLQGQGKKNQSSASNFEKIQSLTNENNILTEQVNQLCLENQTIQRQNRQLKEKLHDSLEQIQKNKHMNLEIYMNTQNQNREEKSTIQLLKNKMIALSREHQIQITKINEQNYQLKNKYLQIKDLEDQYTERIKVLEQKLKLHSAQSQAERKKREKLNDQRQAKIRKLEYELQISKNRVRQLSEDLEVNDLNLRMELEKKQVRFKQLQKEVKSRLIEPSTAQLSPKRSKQNIKDANEENEEQLQYLKIQVEKLRNTNRQLERENLKQKKRTDKVQALQAEKKKLQKIILDVSRCRDSQIQMLVVSLYELRNQNIKMHEIIKQLKWKQESKYD